VANIEELVANYLVSHASCMLDVDMLNAMAFKAVRFYAGWGEITAMAEAGTEVVTTSTELSLSEWGVIGPLFYLYAEKEQATQMEATQVMGMTAFGRTSSEIASEITTMETEIPAKAFSFGVITV
jgi:hypothetical protein